MRAIDVRVHSMNDVHVEARQYVLIADSGDHGYAGRYAAASLVAGRALDRRAFEGGLTGIRIAHTEQLPRVKGMLDLAGVDGPVVVQGWTFRVMRWPLSALWCCSA
jgi:hypothetical protein